MADEEKRPTAASEAEPPAQEEQDYLFKAQVAATEFIFRYWKYGFYALGGILLVALAWGSYQSWAQSRREEQFGAIAAVAYKMPPVNEMALYGLAPKDDPADAARTANLQEGARRFAAAAESASGSAAVYGYLQAAEAYSRAQDAENSRKMIEAATGVSAPDVARFAADAQRAALLADAGDTAGAEAYLREMAGRYTGFFAQESLLRLASVQADAGKSAEAKSTVEELLKRFESPARAQAVAEIAARVGASVPQAASPASPGAPG
ncbi:MAG: hypothetical protein FJ090_18005 [Deltaproteobacteria bacterium]|nr:hypothetical protein [Deltaproteobacteria bacterium]